ncbi:hypothetical protein BDF14DRAFT_1383736 [Spinellus fusiger]|nr:hypothetical protein BDF14DRAFT_1383736 [Spinellus fusiger]
MSISSQTPDPAIQQFNSWEETGLIRNINFQCGRSGSYKNIYGLTSETRKRKCTSRLIGCPFEWNGTKRDEKWHLELGTHHSLRKKNTSEEQERIGPCHFLFKPFLQVAMSVSSFALLKVQEQYTKAVKAVEAVDMTQSTESTQSTQDTQDTRVNTAFPATPLPECTQTFTSTTGLPCAHALYQRLRENPAFSLSISDFHVRWQTKDKLQGTKPESQPQDHGLEAALNVLKESFISWPIQQQTAVVEIIERLAQASPLVLQDAFNQEKRTETAPDTTTDINSVTHRQEIGSVRKHTLSFEFVYGGSCERKCGVCREIGHNARSCARHQHSIP